MRSLARVLAALAAAAVSASAQSIDTIRPQFHVMPPSNWCNDPNGPSFFNGMYHLFYQYNPYGAVWGNMSWGHAASSDLVHWTHLPVALYPDQPYDAGGVFSGSITIANGAPVIAYTCVASDGSESQCLAHPANASDPLLLNWVKDPANPVIGPPPPGGAAGSFRDDTTAWISGGEWKMGVGASVNGVGSVALYRSPDFATWTYETLLWSGADGSSMWECPDFYPVGTTAGASGSQSGLYGAKFSGGGQDWAAFGTYDTTQQRFTATSELALYDGGRWYASKSFFDAKNDRQVLWGWVAEEDNGAPRGWQSLQSLPRVLLADTDLNKLVITPLPELAQLRNRTLGSVQGVTLAPGEVVPLVFDDGLMVELVASFALPASLRRALPCLLARHDARADPIAVSKACEATGRDAASTDAAVADTSSAGVMTSFGLAVRLSADGTQQTRVTLQHSTATGPFNNTDMPGGDYRDYPLPMGVPDSVNVANCSQQCALERECVAWTYVRNLTSSSSSSSSSSVSSSVPSGGVGFPPIPPAPRCSLKSSAPPANPNPACVSGTVESLQLVVNRTNVGGDGSTASPSLPVYLKPTDAALELHVFVDHSVVEVFAQAGRADITARVYPNAADGALGVALFSESASLEPVLVNNVTAWTLGTIWT